MLQDSLHELALQLWTVFEAAPLAFDLIVVDDVHEGLDAHRRRRARSRDRAQLGSVSPEGREATLTRIYYSDTQKALMWERLKQGWTLNEIGRIFHRPHTSIQQIFVRTGGIRPTARARAPTALSLVEREEISRALVAGESIRSTAARLGRAPSTISREIKRNGGIEPYLASQAEDAAWDRGRRPKRCKLRENRSLARLVAEKPRMLWSPEQIAAWLKHTYLCDESLHVSHGTIYQSLFIRW